MGRCDDFYGGTMLKGKAMAAMLVISTHLLMPDSSQPKIIKLPRNGPKPGQSTESWLYGKDKNCQKERDAAAWKRGA